MSDFNRGYFDQYTRPGASGRPLGERPFIFAYWRRKLARMLPGGGVVCDIGCGCGYFLRWPAAPLKTVGLDIAIEALRTARRQGAARLVLGDAGRLPVKDESCAAVVSFDLIEHLALPADFFAEAWRVLPPEGLLVLRTPNPIGFGARIKPRDGRPRRAAPERDVEHGWHRSEIWHGWRDETHRGIRRPDEWRAILAGAGFAVQEAGTDTLWDVPYLRGIPLLVQKIVFLSVHRGVSRIFGFLPWRWGENFICIARKAGSA